MILRFMLIMYVENQISRSYLKSPNLEMWSWDFGRRETRPWKILRHCLWTNGFLSNPDPGENFVSGNLVMETGCTSLDRPLLLQAGTRLRKFQWSQYQPFLLIPSLLRPWGGVRAKMRSRQTEQQSNNNESQAVACQKVKAAERTIGTILKPAIKKTDNVKRDIVEFCCGGNSKIGQSKYQRDDCTVTRFTLEDDVTTDQGLYKAFEAVRYENCLLRASIPCTGGSPWQNINAKRPGGFEKVKEHKYGPRSKLWQTNNANMEVV